MEALKTLSVLIVLINVIVHGSSNLEIVHNSLKVINLIFSKLQTYKIFFCSKFELQINNLFN